MAGQRGGTFCVKNAPEAKKDSRLLKSNSKVRRKRCGGGSTKVRHLGIRISRKSHSKRGEGGFDTQKEESACEKQGTRTK